MTVRVLAATGSLGLAPTDPARSFHRALERAPQAIVADAGSADVGPAYLGANANYNDPAWEEHDFAHLLAGAHELGVPLVVGSCGVHGSDAGVDRYADIVDRVGRRLGLRFTTALIYAEVGRGWLHRRLRDGAVTPLDGVEPLSAAEIDASARLVASMGPQPIQAALSAGAQLVLAGRAVDDALFAAPLMLQGADAPSAFLAGKLLENASLVATPFAIRESVIADVGDGVVLEPMLPEQRCTRASVAAQLMYERRTPLRQAGPGGVLELDDVRIEELDERRARVHGAHWRATPPAVKVEGSGQTGFRATTLAGCRDRGLIAALDDVLPAVRARVEATGARVATHVYGRDAVMGVFEPTPRAGHEAAIVIETVAATQAEAERAALLAKRTLFGARYPGQKATAGTVTAMLDEVWLGGPAYRWTVHHLVAVDDPAEPFRVELRRLGSR